MGLKGKVLVYKEKFLKAIKRLLTEGVTPEKLGITVMLGFLFGIIPILGINTFILAFIALRFRLNMAIIQTINYAAYPLQMMFLIPFFKAGQWIFKAEGAVDFSFTHLKQLFSANFFNAASEFGFMVFKGLSVWLLISIPVGILIYSIFVNLFRSLLVRVSRKRA